MLQFSRLVDSEISRQTESRLRELLDDSFEGDFSPEDWEHTCGGIRFLGYLGDQLLAHGAVVSRSIQVDGIRTLMGYVEGVAVDPRNWRNGYGTQLLSEITRHCRSEFQLSMLSTGDKEFYRRHGWLDFEGESYILQEGVKVRSEDEDEGLMFLLGLQYQEVHPKEVVCESRTGDSW